MKNYTSIQIKNIKDGTFIDVANVDHDYSDFADGIVDELKGALVSKDHEIVTMEHGTHADAEKHLVETFQMGEKLMAYIKDHPNDSSLGKAVRSAYHEIVKS